MNIDKLDQLRLLKERVISRQDPLHYIGTHSAIQSYDGGKMFSPYESQKEYLNTLIDDRFVICKSGRQTGLTVSTMMYIFWYAMHHENKNIFILTHDFNQARDNLDTIRFAFDNLPAPLRYDIELTENLKDRCGFSNGTRILASSSPYCTRGCSIDLLHVDNFELFKPDVQEEIFICTIPSMSCSKDSKMFVTSSCAGGVGSTFFNKIFKEAQEGTNGWTPIILKRPETEPKIWGRDKP